MSGKELARHVQKVNGRGKRPEDYRSAVLDVSECWRQCHGSVTWLLLPLIQTQKQG